MNLRDLLDLVNKEKRKRERVKIAQKVVAGIGVVTVVGVATRIIFAPKSGKETREGMRKIAVNTVESIKAAVQKKADTVKDSVTHVAHDVRILLKDVQGKTTDDVKKVIKDGGHEIIKDIQKTEEIISNELNKSVK